MSDNDLHEMKHVLECLWFKYENEAAIKTKMFSHIQNHLPTLLDNTHRNIIEKKTKKKQYIDLCQEFTDEYLEENQFFYLHSCNEFIKYNNIDYSCISEDDLYYEILTALNKRSEYSEYKQKIKTHVVKQIKDQSITTSIPESSTIQSTLSLLVPAVFPSKSEVKYFLTILGDNIMKKNDQVIHIINNNIKPFFNQLAEILTAYLGTAHGINSFKYKYHDQTYNKTRLLRTSFHINSNVVWSVNLPRNILNIIAVACHYSSRYDNSDIFVEKAIRDHNVKEYIFYLKNNTTDKIINDFSCDMLSIKNDQSHSSKINMKNMVYLWKLYLEKKNLPNIMFINTFKNRLKQEITYNEEVDAFVNVTSKHLPFVSNFLQFWNSNIIISEEDGQEYEIDEIAQLFKRFCENITVNVSISDDSILNVIKHFFPNVIISSDKYVTNITCELWNKTKDIDLYITKFHDDCHIHDEMKSQSFNTIYKYYCKELPKNSFVVSKHFFETRLLSVTKEHVINAKCIKASWWAN
jgi:hypothetical protein